MPKSGFLGRKPWRSAAHLERNQLPDRPTCGTIPVCAQEEFDALLDAGNPGLSVIAQR
jgi:hypothetical protein